LSISLLSFSDCIHPRIALAFPTFSSNLEESVALLINSFPALNAKEGLPE